MACFAELSDMCGEPVKFLNIVFVFQQAIPMRNLGHCLCKMPLMSVDEQTYSFQILWRFWYCLRFSFIYLNFNTWAI